MPLLFDKLKNKVKKTKAVKKLIFLQLICLKKGNNVISCRNFKKTLKFNFTVTQTTLYN